MKTALIGYTGFVGQNIKNQYKFNDLYNSENIRDIVGKKYDLVVCAGVTGTKWIANSNSRKDLNNIKALISILEKTEIKSIIHISTLDVYPFPINKVNEESIINSNLLLPYGRNRFYIENFIRNKFKNFIIVRLPGLFGVGLKKNFIYDFIHKRKFYLTNSESFVQLYNLNYIWRDIKIAYKNNLALVNFATQPILVKDIIKEVFNFKIENKNAIKTYYNAFSLYAKYFNKNKNYLYMKEEILKDLKKFIKEYKF